MTEFLAAETRWEMAWMAWVGDVLPPTILFLSYASLGILALYGLHRLALVWSYRRHDEPDPVPPSLESEPTDEWPTDGAAADLQRAVRRRAPDRGGLRP